MQGVRLTTAAYCLSYDCLELGIHSPLHFYGVLLKQAQGTFSITEIKWHFLMPNTAAQPSCSIDFMLPNETLHMQMHMFQYSV
jgi:hypothetical protein